MKALLFALFVLPACCFAAPTITVTAGGNAVADGGFVEVLHNSTLAGLQLELRVGGNETDPVSLAGTVSGVTTHGILDTEFSAAAATGPYTVAPTSGTFVVVPATHTVSLVASDGINPDVTFTFEIRVVQDFGKAVGCYKAHPARDSGACVAGPSAGAPLAVLFALLARRRE